MQATVLNRIHISETESTNTLAKEYIERGVRSGTAIIADYQNSGKGRLGKSWHSVPGKGLYCSIIIKPRCSREQISLITLLTGLVVAETIESIGCKASVKLKWPNDIIVNDKKCGGILCEAVLGKQEDDYVVVGIGVNVNLVKADIPSELYHKVTSLQLEFKKSFEIDLVFNKIYENLLRRLEKFEKAGFEKFMDDWRKRDYLKGKRAAWCTVRQEMVTGIAVSLADTGEYYIKDDKGVLHQVLSGDISIATK